MPCGQGAQRLGGACADLAARLRAQRGFGAFPLHAVLHRHRHAVQRAQHDAGGQQPVGGVCASARSAVTTLYALSAPARSMRSRNAAAGATSAFSTDGAADAEGVLEVQGGIGCGHGAS